MCLGLALSTWVPARAAPSANRAPQGDARRGEVIYETGRRADGSPVAALRVGMTGTLPPDSAACVNCHRPSGLGQREGRVLVPGVAGHLLFAPLQRATTPRLHTSIRQQSLRAYDRAAYTRESLARALREGQDVQGRPLEPIMPRYALDDRDVADVEAHLRAQSLRPLHGVHQGTLHLATVVTPQANEAARQTVTTAMQHWAERLKLGGWTVRWRLWALNGPAPSWPEQLKAHWAEQPVFALVSGAGGIDWAPVANFCDAHRVPCVFPSVEAVPEKASSGRFSFYLSGGVAAEAALLAHGVSATANLNSSTPSTPPVEKLAGVVHFTLRDDAAGDVASKAFDRSLKTTALSLPTRLMAGTLADLGSALASVQTNEATALWLHAADLNRLMQAHAPPPGSGPVWVSASLAPPHRVHPPAAWRSRLVWASLQSDNVRRSAGGALSARPWAASLALPEGMDWVILNDVHAATFYFTDTLARMREGLNAEYFTERLEDAVGLGPAGAGYFRLSLGPNQRVAAQSGHLLGFTDGQAEHPVKLSPLLRAEIPGAP
jgi:Cytochrome c